MEKPKNKKSSLEIKPKDLRKNVLALFEEISKNESVKNSFIHNPVEQITKKVMKRELPSQQISEANRFLFSLLANDEMVEWLNSYSKERKDEKLDKKQFAVNFAKEISKLGDENIIISLVSNAVLDYGIPGITDVAYQCVYHELPNKNEWACTPVAKDNSSPEMGIDPGMLRSLTEHLISYAKELKNMGRLADLNTQIL